MNARFRRAFLQLYMYFLHIIVTESPLLCEKVCRGHLCAFVMPLGGALALNRCLKDTWQYHWPC